MKCTKILRILSLVIILSLLVVAIPATPVQAVREITLDPEEGSIGDRITIEGTDFNKSTEEYDKYATIYFSSDKAGTVDDIDDEVTHYEIVKDGVWLDEEGAFETTFTVPDVLDDGDDEEDVTSGTYYVYVCHYGYTRVVATAEFALIAGRITIDPDEGPVATEVEITGTDFSSNKEITIEYDGDAVDIDGDDETDSGGDFISYILVPESTTGVHTITITVAGSEVEAEFTVEPEIIVSPTSGGADTTVAVSGTGFGRRQDVVVYFNSAGMTTVTTDSGGSFDATFNVPDLEEDIYDIEAEDEDENLDAAKFTITVPSTPTPAPAPTPAPTPPPPPPTAVKISLTSGKVGSTVMITGTGFEADGTITIEYDDEEVTTATADANGLFIVMFKVPTSKSGDHTITITDGTNTEELTFTVESEPPPAPAPLLPEMGVQLKPPLSFDWKEVTADSPPVTYTLQIATDDDFTTDSMVLEKEGLTKSEYTVTEAETVELVGQEALYYWRVRAVDAAASEGAWTGAGQFYVTPPFSFPNWAIYTLLGLGGLVLFAIGYWMGRRTAYYY